MRPNGLTVAVLACAGLASAAPGSVPEDPGPLWTSVHAAAAARDSVASPDNLRLFVTGHAHSYDDASFVTIGYSASTGAELWFAEYNGPVRGFDGARAVAVSRDASRVYVTGTSWGGPGFGEDYATVAYSAATGTQEWVARYNASENSIDGPSSIAVSPDGSRVYVTGWSGPPFSSDYATIAYSAATGAQEWVARYNGPADGRDGASSVAVSPDGSRVYVTGMATASSSGRSDYATLSYVAATGSPEWIARYSAPGASTNAAHEIEVSPDGTQVYVTGNSGWPENLDYTTVAYSAATGAQQWVARYDGPGGSPFPESTDDFVFSLAVSADGSRVFVAGQSAGDLGTWDYATLAYSAADGTQEWLARYDGPAYSYDGALSIASSPDGSLVHVTGYSAGLTTEADYATLAYAAATGARKWIARAGPAGDSWDVAISLAAGPDGARVHVTGLSGSDLATIAYSAHSCASGNDEAGPVSGTLHEFVEPLAGIAAGFIHGVNCDVVAPAFRPPSYLRAPMASGSRRSAQAAASPLLRRPLFIKMLLT